MSFKIRLIKFHSLRHAVDLDSFHPRDSSWSWDSPSSSIMQTNKYGNSYGLLRNIRGVLYRIFFLTYIIFSAYSLGAANSANNR